MSEHSAAAVAAPPRERILHANLATMSRGNADVAQQLRECEPSPDVSFIETPQSVPAGIYFGRQLCSRQRPLDEAKRLIEPIDLVEHAVVVVLGFGMGYHVQALAERMGKAGAIIVFEPDVALLRAVLERVDHSKWLAENNIVWMTSESDRGVLAAKLQGAESILGQGVEILDHPASRDRLGGGGPAFSRMFTEHMDSARTLLLTNLVRAVDTVRNMVLNVDHYVAGPGIDDLKDAAAGFPSVVVSAGPSLRRNMHLLGARGEPGVRDRCVIIAVQTALKPLLQAGIRPHYVTALDYHEISTRFYEDLTAEDVAGITLVVEPKVHPAVIDAWPGPAESVRCCSAKFLDDLLGDIAPNHGSLPAGATVAHLAVYLARHLGCDPIATIGQDLGFTDGLYYGPGTAIDDVWSPELGPFNTIEMMQWQRIVRHRRHLQKLMDARGRPIYTDAQMAAYLQQFERDFAAYEREGVRIIDATEGGVPKQHTVNMPLQEVLATYATRPLPPSEPGRVAPAPETDRLGAARQRIAQMRRDIAGLRETSRRTQRLIEKMLADQSDPAKMKRHFAKLEQHQQRVRKREAAFTLLDSFNQLGAFKRRKADRRLHMTGDLSPMQRQRFELERDMENVIWLADAAEEMIDQLAQAEQLLETSKRPNVQTSKRGHRESGVTASRKKADVAVAALVPVDPQRSGLGVEQSLAEVIDGRTVIQATLERLGQSKLLKEIVLIVPESFDVEPLLDRKRIGRPVQVERCEGESPFGPEQRAIAVARLFAGSGSTGWRGGIAGMSIYDEVLCPTIMHDVMQRRGLGAALLTGPGWPLVDVDGADGAGGCDAVIARYLDAPERFPIVFTQAPPGLCGCVVSAQLMKDLAAGSAETGRSRLTTIGSLLAYQPSLPQPDPIGTDANVPIDHRVRNVMMRATHETSKRPNVQTSKIPEQSGPCDLDRLPRHVVLELTAIRTSCGLFAQRLLQAPSTLPQAAAASSFEVSTFRRFDVSIAQRIFNELAEAGSAVVTLGGLGDPLLHEQFDDVIKSAKQAGIPAVHVRTELLCGSDVLDRLLDSGVDVISIDLHADTPATYQRMMGCDRLQEVMENIQYLTRGRGLSTLALPWIVPRLQRCAETFSDLEPFFDRWQHVLGTPVIEGGPGGAVEGDELEPAVTPQRVIDRELQQRMFICADGSVPVCEVDRSVVAGSVATQTLREVWAALLEQRNQAKASRQPPRMLFP